MNKHFLISLFGLLLFHSVFSQSKDSSLLVFVDGFSFSAREPKGWVGDIEDATVFKANIIFYESKAELENGGALIQISTFTKKDENTISDLQADINSYKKEYIKLKTKGFVAKHKVYKCYSKLVYVDKDFYRYIVYINPGEKYKSGLSASMNISRRRARSGELKAYLDIIASLIMFSK